MRSVKEFIILFIFFLHSVVVYGGHVKGWAKTSKPQKNSLRLYIEDNANRILITTEENGKLDDCYLSGDEYIIDLALQIVNKSEVTIVSRNDMHDLVEICTYAKWSGSLGTGEAEIYRQMGNISAMLIYPGTKWCGAGNVSEGYDDLGPEKETDACCREHDHCPDSIEKFGSKYGLDNNSAFTKSNCDCDDTFYDCLRNVNVKSSNRVGKIYFNYIRMECFRHTYPIKRCSKYKGSIRPRCVEYDLDETQEPVWQWFDAREYRSLDEDKLRQFKYKQNMLKYVLNS